MNDKNQYKIIDDYVIGYDSKGREFYFDLEDYELVSKYKWYVHTNGYVRAGIYDKNTKEITQIQLHRLVMNADENVIIDHISGKRNDNRKYNLRNANYSTNMMNSGISKNNTSGVRGVNYDKDTGQWRVRIQVNNKRISLGSFSDIEKAIRVRQQAEEKYFGEYAYKNIQ